MRRVFFQVVSEKPWATVRSFLVGKPSDQYGMLTHGAPVFYLMLELLLTTYLLLALIFWVANALSTANQRELTPARRRIRHNSNMASQARTRRTWHDVAAGVMTLFSSFERASAGGLPWPS
jgi:hypothetical protein